MEREKKTTKAQRQKLNSFCLCAFVVFFSLSIRTGRDFFDTPDSLFTHPGKVGSSIASN